MRCFTGVLWRHKAIKQVQNNSSKAPHVSALPKLTKGNKLPPIAGLTILPKVPKLPAVSKGPGVIL
jgi:hypothetical protein